MALRLPHHFKWVLVNILMLYVCSTATVMAARPDPVKRLLHLKASPWHIVAPGSDSSPGVICVSDAPNWDCSGVSPAEGSISVAAPSFAPLFQAPGSDPFLLDPSISTPVSSPAPSPLSLSSNGFLPKSPSSAPVSSAIPSVISTPPRVPILAPDNSPSNPLEGSFSSSENSQLVDIHAGAPSARISPTSSQNFKKHKAGLSHAAVAGIGFSIFLFLAVIVFIAYHVVSRDPHQHTETTASASASILHNSRHRG
ncbi:hypothetical protein O6H91_10G046200 [Diphasiastrum complanatum]|uniref:Uncharacterized protein n=1 Tax=Diphasiastrum complanatum TaxID=34168 RepID=A0ACC2CGZ3_DIPCM|nr:hypothetical protein O6H91_10G046200 [Diphasiastrum complanatum]